MVYYYTVYFSQLCILCLQLKEDMSQENLPHFTVISGMRFTNDASIAPRLLEEIHNNPQLVKTDASSAVYSGWIDVLSKSSL